MRSRNEQIGPNDVPSYRELQVLSEVEGSPTITQRELSQRVGIALGLTNAVLRNLMKRGYVRATQAGWKRWLYAITPEGFSHKVRLTVAYVHRVLDHYQKVRQTLREQLEPLALHQESRIAIYGTGEFAELVYLGLRDMDIEEMDFFTSEMSDGLRFLGTPVRDIGTLQTDNYDWIVVASLASSKAVCNTLKDQGVAAEKLVTFFPNGVVRESV